VQEQHQHHGFLWLLALIRLAKGTRGYPFESGEEKGLEPIPNTTAAIDFTFNSGYEKH